ncbi:hypothetical protein [Chitinophaga rhizophila]|uniref:Uncharacterized protein n=1 Tax=Chitinophaga rhizophila TaxID=2866212 RepID=A0ABS7G729_9BACT|nr:hypothetical protein [Chitinophaga rhizophila]MBW8683463.1 hypothetical protein [Chitinophaga rhizophila]
MRLQISFTIGAFENTGSAFQFILDHLNCNMTSIFSNKAYSSNDWITDTDEIVRELVNTNDNSFTIHNGSEPDATLYDENVSMVTFLREQNYQIEILTFDIEDESFLDLEKLLLAANKLGFTTAQRFDYEKARWQSEQIVSNFEVFQKTHEHRQKVVHPVWGKSSGLTIDISNNPGRDILTFGMRLFAAPEMWFGAGAWQYFDLNNLLACTIVEESRRITDNLLYVKLFDVDTEDYEHLSILKLQREFRKCSKMDEVEELLNNKLPFKRYY